jgi:hypothetical protein
MLDISNIFYENKKHYIRVILKHYKEKPKIKLFKRPVPIGVGASDRPQETL